VKEEQLSSLVESESIPERTSEISTERKRSDKRMEASESFKFTEEESEKLRNVKFAAFFVSIMSQCFHNKIPAKLMVGRDDETGKFLPQAKKDVLNPCRRQLDKMVTCYNNRSKVAPRDVIIAKNDLYNCVISNKDYFYDPENETRFLQPILYQPQVRNGNLDDTISAPPVVRVRNGNIDHLVPSPVKVRNGNLGDMNNHCNTGASLYDNKDSLKPKQKELCFL